VLQFCWNFELIQFCQNYGETFSETFGNISGKSCPPSPPKKTWEFSYTALCKIYIFATNLIITLEILSSADLNYFIGGMRNCVQVIWLGLPSMWYKSHVYNVFPKILSKFHPECVKFWRNFWEHIIYMWKFLTFLQKLSGSFRVKLTKVLLPQHYLWRVLHHISTVKCMTLL